MRVPQPAFPAFSGTASVRRLLPVLLIPIFGSSAQSPRPVPAPHPTLVVFLTIDQFRADYLTLFERQLTGGLGRLLHGGAVYLNGYQDHAITETAPGHASTMSGRFPAHTGIVSNAAGVADPQAPLIGGATGDGASPFRFRGTTLADWLRYHDPHSRALSVSRKDRGAILPLGRAKQQAYWYASYGGFTTSTYYADTLPAWVRRFNSKRLPQRWAGKAWDLLRPGSEYVEPDSVPLESGGTDFVFPHPFPPDSARTAALFANYPMMDQVTLAFALRGVRELDLGAGPGTDLLAISLSSTDAIGHRFGPDSREIHDQVLRVDQYLGQFLDSLYALRDSTRIVIALTADHGVTPMPGMASRYPNSGAGFVDIAPTIAEFKSAIANAGAGHDALEFEEGMLELDAPSLAKAGLNADSIAHRFSVAAAKIPGVQRADLVRSLAARDTTTDQVARRWLHMLPADVPAYVVVTLKPYWYWKGIGFVTHGSPNDQDARVPIILFGDGIRPGRHQERALVVDLAPTLAAIVGVRPMETLDGRVLRSALRD